MLMHNHTRNTRIHLAEKNMDTISHAQGNMSALFYGHGNMSKNWNLPLFVSYAQIAIAKVPTTIRINPASAFLLNFSLNTK